MPAPSEDLQLRGFGDQEVGGDDAAGSTEMLTSAVCSAGASLMPSPRKPIEGPLFCKARTIRFFRCGIRHDEKTRIFGEVPECIVGHRTDLLASQHGGRFDTDRLGSCRLGKFGVEHPQASDGWEMEIHDAPPEPDIGGRHMHFSMGCRCWLQLRPTWSSLDAHLLEGGVRMLTGCAQLGQANRSAVRQLTILSRTETPCAVSSRENQSRESHQVRPPTAPLMIFRCNSSGAGSSININTDKSTERLGFGR